METLTPEEGLILTRLIEELKQHPRLRLALLEALQLTALLDMPAQLNALQKTVEEVLRRQEEQGRRQDEQGQTLREHGQMLQEHGQMLQEHGQMLQEHGQMLREHGQRLDRIEKDLSVLKGRSEEAEARKRIPAVFGRFLRKTRVHDSEQFTPIAEEQFVLSEDDFSELLFADLFVSGQLKRDGRPIWLVVEVSWGVGIADVERAHARAAILRQAGADAYGAVMGQTITRAARQRAQQLGVIVALDGKLYNLEVLNAQA